MQVIAICQLSFFSQAAIHGRDEQHFRAEWLNTQIMRIGCEVKWEWNEMCVSTVFAHYLKNLVTLIDTENHYY